MIVTNGGVIRVDELLYLYCLKELKEFGYYELVPWDRKARLIDSLPLSFYYWKSRYFLCLVIVGRLFQMTSGVMSPDYNVGGGHPNLVRFFFVLFLFFGKFFFVLSNPYTCFFYFSFSEDSS